MSFTYQTISKTRRFQSDHPQKTAPGAYDWTLSARTPGERDLCPHSGTFTVVEPRQKARLRIGWLTDPPKPIILIQFP
jgi:hypothetical protein